MPFDADGIWTPNTKQGKYLAIPDSIREAFYGGGAGSGKSEILLMYGVAKGWTKNPKFKQLFTRRTFPELRNEIVPRSREIYSRFGATFNKSDMCWTFPREDQYGGTGLGNAGAMIFLGHIENEDDARKYDSMEINLYTPDELTSHLEFQYLYISFTRVRSSDSNLPAIIRAAGMPGGIGHNWVKKRFVDPAPGGSVIIKGRGGNKRIYIHATQNDNKKNIDPTYATALAALPEAEKQAKLFGDWSAYEGQVFSEFRDRPYPDEPPEALHVIKPFDIPVWWPKIIGIDWGYASPAMTWVGYGAISPLGRVYIYREQAWSETKIEEWAGYVKYWIDKENPRIIRLCKSAGQDRGQEHTILQQISTALDRSVELSNNSSGSRVAGKLLIHEYFRWKQKYVPPKEIGTYNDEYAQKLLRLRGLGEYKAYIASFTPQEPELNLPKCQIFNDDNDPDRSCPLLINAIKSAVYDKTNKEDIAEFPGDDPYDGFRYLLDSVEAYFNTSKEEFEKVQKQELLVQQLAASNNWTAFYRGMERSESTSLIVQPISRYRKH